MSTELESLRKEHIATGAELEELRLRHTETSTELENQRVSQLNLTVGIETLQARTVTLLDNLQSAKESHAADIERLRTEHEQALRDKGVQLDALLTEAEHEHHVELQKLRVDIADAAEALAQTHQQHGETLEKLYADHALELEQRGKEVEAFLGQSQSEQAETLSRLQSEHSQALRKEGERSHLRIQQIRAEHTSVLAELQSAHDEKSLQMKAEAASALDRMRAECTAELKAAELAKDAALIESQSHHEAVVQSLQEEHAAAIVSKEQTHQEALAKARQDHDLVMTNLERNRTAALEQARSDYSSALKKFEADKAIDVARLQEDLHKSRLEHEASISKHSEELEAAVQLAKEQHTAFVQELERGHLNALNSLNTRHEAILAQAMAAQQEEQAVLVKSHTESNLRLRAEHQAALTQVNDALVLAQEQHSLALDDVRGQNEALFSQAQEKYVTTLEALKSTHAQERETLSRDHELLVQEVAAYKSAMDEFTVTRQQIGEAHEEAMVKKDLLIVSLEEDLVIAREQHAELATTAEALKAELDNTRNQTTELVKEASKRESLVHDLERHRSLLGEVQINLQKTRDERDNLAAEKTRQDDILRQLQAQMDAQPSSKVHDNTSPARPLLEHRGGSLSRINGIPPAKAPPLSPPPLGPPPPTPGPLPRLPSETGHTRSSATISSSSRTSQTDSPLVASTSATSTASPIANGHTPIDPKVEEQTRQLEEQETMIKTLNKQLTHCEGDLQAHMDLVSTLETQLNDSERNRGYFIDYG